MEQIEPVCWIGGIDGYLRLIDQTALPAELKYIACHDVDRLWEAICALRVRGAPAIGVAGAYGLCLAARAALGFGPPGQADRSVQFAAPTDQGSIETDRPREHAGPAVTGQSSVEPPLSGPVGISSELLLSRLKQAADYLQSSRPTAVNLSWALRRVVQKAEEYASRNPLDIAGAVLSEAHAICQEDRQMCRDIGRHGAGLLGDGQTVLTHCNAGALATAGYGTALGVIYAAAESGKRLRVFACETRPLLQGARLTAWELQRSGIDVTLICDSMAAELMRQGRIGAVIVGADRIARNGDVANKIGTYALAVAAAAHAVPFYVAAPSSTFDLSIASGREIPIEQRDPREVTHGFGRQTAPEGIAVYNPAFDVTPAALVTAVICERGVIKPVAEWNIRRLLEKP